MGLFDTYGESQLKAGAPYQNHWEVGDSVTIPDGVYPGCPNFIVIKDGRFIAELERLYDYLGGYWADADTVADSGICNMRSDA